MEQEEKEEDQEEKKEKKEEKIRLLLFQSIPGSPELRSGRGSAPIPTRARPADAGHPGPRSQSPIDRDQTRADV